MGATLWEHEANWQPDPAAALRDLQAAEFRRAFDFEKELERWRVDGEYALKAEQEAGDPYGLARSWTKQLQRVAAAKLNPPASVAEQIDVLRRVRPEGFGDVLDVTDVNVTGGVHVARLLGPDELVSMFGTDRPSGDVAARQRHAVADRVGRGESAAFAVYGDNGKPIRWAFVGYSAD